MLRERLKKYRIILASGSPRRQHFLREMGLDFTVDVRPIREVFPERLRAGEISDYIALQKAEAFAGSLHPRDILITADTVVWHRGRALAKASDAGEARAMLRSLSGERHEVITSVCFVLQGKTTVINDVTQVWFGNLSEEDIDFYIGQFNPFDKAGAYGIQEWIGLIGVVEIKGAYTTVVGLPTYKVYHTLDQLLR